MKVQITPIEFSIFDLMVHAGNECLSNVDEFSLQLAIQKAVDNILVRRNWMDRYMVILSADTNSSSRWSVGWNKDEDSCDGAEWLTRRCYNVRAVNKELPRWVREVLTSLDYETIELGAGL